MLDMSSRVVAEGRARRLADVRPLSELSEKADRDERLFGSDHPSVKAFRAEVNKRKGR